MLNKELLMIGDQSYSSVSVTLHFYGGLHCGVFYNWISPDGTINQNRVYIQSVDIFRTLTCKPNTTVSLSIESYIVDSRATPPQDITVVEDPDGKQVIFTAFRDVVVDFMSYA